MKASAAKEFYNYKSPYRVELRKDDPTVSYYVRIFTPVIKEAKRKKMKPEIPIPYPTLLAKSIWGKLLGRKLKRGEIPNFEEEVCDGEAS